MTDFLIQKADNRGERYHQSPGIWFSKEMRRWVVTSPELVRQAMLDDSFSVPSYDVSSVTQKLGIDLRYLEELRKWFPLAHEGERHRELRELFARHIATYSRPALSTMEADLQSLRPSLVNMRSGEVLCIFNALFRPVISRAVCALANAEIANNVGIVSVPQLFDDAISPSRRRAINKIIGDMIEAMPSEWDDARKYQSAAVIAVSANTLLGSVALTFVQALQKSPAALMSEIEWGSDLIRTGLPLIEKVTIRDTNLGTVTLEKGSRVRLFVEADGVLPDRGYRYSDLFFAVGVHKCVGMNFSKLVWMRLRDFFRGIDRSVSLVSVDERPGDYVFNLPERIEVRFHD